MIDVFQTRMPGPQTSGLLSWIQAALTQTSLLFAKSVPRSIQSTHTYAGPPTRQAPGAGAVLLSRPPPACPRTHSDPEPGGARSALEPRPPPTRARATGHRAPAQPPARRDARLSPRARLCPRAQAPPLPRAANGRGGWGRLRPPGEPRPPIGPLGAVSPHVGRGRGRGGVNGVDAIPRPHPPPRPARPAPRGAQSRSSRSARPPPARCPLPAARDSCVRLPGAGPHGAHLRWPSAARCPSASWRGRTCLPRTCERSLGGSPNFPGRGAASYA